ncbi:MAG: transcriptional repressor [Vampirovibrio sp.]|nr:transcriptional repressor [Vampirovibrio sp.]
MNYTNAAIEVLKSKGYRITQPRKLVLDALEKSFTPLSAYELKDLLDEAGQKVDTVSVYRILDCLEKTHLVHRLVSSGKVLKCDLGHEDPEEPCHRDQSDHCHHFLVCRSCDNIEEIHCVGIDELAHHALKDTGFQVEEHRLEFLGRCKKCK